MSLIISLGHSHIQELYGNQLLDLILDPNSDGNWILVFQGGKDGISSIKNCTNAERARGKTLLRHTVHPDWKGLDLLFSDDVSVAVEGNPGSLIVTSGYQLPAAKL